MQFTFLDMAGKTLFTRDDAERAQWTQEEMTLELEFPRIESKVISIGQRVFFIDPSTGNHQIYEVKQARNIEPDHYQTVTAEHICISELSDEHIDNSQIDNKTAQEALQGVLNGTLWNVGTYDFNPVSSGDVTRGGVWQAVLEIKDNWNVYIEPRVTLSSDGTITRALDIINPDGVWNGVRLSIDKNFLDPSVTYDDSEVVTALFGYGGTTVPTSSSEEEKEIDFSDVVWEQTSEHPAKPKGQKYLEDPSATQKYGRNGRPRFGFYQNTNIEDPNVLIEKTWETLKTVSKPAISIEGTVADLYRLGYADQPIKLHDIAIVEVIPAGYKDQVQIIRMTTDLIDPSATTLTIGSYIPNIIYIERQTNEQATGSRGGGGGNKSKETVRSEYETAISKNNRMIQLRAYQNDLDDLDNEVKLQDAKITIEANRITQEITDRRNEGTVLSSRIDSTATQITAEVTRATASENALNGRIQVNADRVALVVTEFEGSDVVNSASIVAGINSHSGQSSSYVKIAADTINLTGYVTASELAVTNARINNLMSGSAVASQLHATTVNTSVLKVANSQASWKVANIPGYGYLNYLGA